ncbi:MAG: NAD(P)-dependent oxidoreductase [Candidatus Nezhaarchaeota archaeon]|nr:NAD(P)-dependent oxidoreductase [Candidatus Nezhaarchaeota archaeon]
MDYTIGIVGGSGFVGYSLAKFLSESFHIKILDIKQPSNQLSGDVEYVPCDIRNYEHAKSCFKDVDLVIHASIVQIPLINEQKRLGYEVNVVGTQNVCRAVEENARIKGMILTGSWHTIGERELRGIIDEEFGFRPDKVEERARLYALSKIAQESIVRFYDEMSDKIYGIIRMGTVLGESMPEKTAANIFIEKGLRGEAITPFKHSMYRPMLYVDIEDVCRVYKNFSTKILNGQLEKGENSLKHIVNAYYPKPITILELAEIVKRAIIKFSNGNIQPKIEIIDTGQPTLFTKDDVKKIKVDISRLKNFLDINDMKSPEESINRIVKHRIQKI